MDNILHGELEERPNGKVTEFEKRNSKDCNFGNPWERLSDQEDSEEDTEFQCHQPEKETTKNVTNDAGTMSETGPIYENHVAEMLQREYEESTSGNQTQEMAAKAPSEHEVDEEAAEVLVRREKRVVDTDDIPDTHVALAWLITVCFNIPLGVIAIYLSMKASKLFLAGKEKQGRRYTQLSLFASLAGIVITVLCVMGAILYLAVTEAAARKKRGYG